MRRLVLLALVCASACKREPDAAPVVETPWDHCRAMLKVSAAAKRPIETVEKCRALFKGNCRTALEGAHVGLTVDEGTKILRTCAATYCPVQPYSPLCHDPMTLWDAVHGMQSFVHFGLKGMPSADEYELAEIGDMMGKELVPVQPVLAHATVGEHGVVTLALDGGGSWNIPAHPRPEDAHDFARAVAKAGGHDVGVEVRGMTLADHDVRVAVDTALLREDVLDAYYR